MWDRETKISFIFRIYNSFFSFSFFSFSLHPFFFASFFSFLFLPSLPLGFSPPLTLTDLEACGPLSDTVRDRSTEILALIRDVLQVMPTAVEVRECERERERERERKRERERERKRERERDMIQYDGICTVLY